MQNYYSSETIRSMDQRRRATFINSLSGFKSVCLIGTKSPDNKTNLAIFSSIFHLGANPALIGFIVRPDSVERHTFENIMSTGFYTLNHITEKIVVNAHQTSARYKRSDSEFENCGLTEEYLHDFHAPFVKESKVKIGLQLRESKKLEINDTTLVIGEINHIHLDGNCVGPDGFIDLESMGTVTCSGLDSYHITKNISRFSYAKPDKWPIKVNVESSVE